MVDGPYWVDRSDPNIGVTPLIACTAREDNEETLNIVKFLIARGAGIETRDTGPGTTPLFMCAQNDMPLLLKFFVDKGAAIDANSSTSCTQPICIAAANGNAKCVAVLANAAKEQGKQHILDLPNQLQTRVPIWFAVARGFAEIVGVLAKAGADLRRGIPCYYEEFIMGGERTATFDPGPGAPQYALDATVFSFVQRRCVACTGTASSTCSRCKMATYCCRKCQENDFKAHKRVCKRIKAGLDMFGKVGDPLPSPSREPFGFQEEFSGTDFDVPEYEDYDQTAETHPVWEYDCGQSGSPDWRRYPRNVEWNIEQLLINDSTRYMYRPGHPECEGMYEREISPSPNGRVNPGVSTCFIYFADMIEREVYTGAARLVRRNGSSKPPTVEAGELY